ncbi:MAG: hypothetical protein BMS9Abin20_0906 [Acidimicrobiia bacterium]|nr:MAG: hypothetical protein BMS9Abin20_0906 [Acidimicrobiia bacterium]
MGRVSARGWNGSCEHAGIRGALTDLELSMLANPSNLESLIRAGQELAADVDTVELT